MGSLLVQVPPATPLEVSETVESGHKGVGGLPVMVPAAFGVTVMVNVMGEPVQLPFNMGVTVTVAVTGLVVLLVAVKALILPLPLNPKPTFRLLVQL